MLKVGVRHGDLAVNLGRKGGKITLMQRDGGGSLEWQDWDYCTGIDVPGVSRRSGRADDRDPMMGG